MNRLIDCLAAFFFKLLVFTFLWYFGFVLGLLCPQVICASDQLYTFCYVSQVDKDHYVRTYYFENAEKVLEIKYQHHFDISHNYNGEYAAEIYYWIDIVVQTYNEVDPFLIEAVIWQESNYNPRDLSSAGARGLMQVIPKYHQHRLNKLIEQNYLLGTIEEPWYDIMLNILVGTDYLWDCLAASGGNEARALMMYNAGNVGARQYDRGYVSSYAKSVLEKRDYLLRVYAELGVEK